MDEIYEKYARFVYRYLLSLGTREDVAEELTQETFYQAVQSIHRFKGESKISTWLCAIAKNQYAIWRRKNPELLELDESFMARSFGEEIDKVELLKRLHNLPEASREILYLRIYGNLSFRQIGEVLSVSENAARVQYYRAREKLRKELEEDGA